jgi:hypothetical protein
LVAFDEPHMQLLRNAPTAHADAIDAFLKSIGFVAAAL